MATESDWRKACKANDKAQARLALAKRMMRQPTAQEIAKANETADEADRIYELWLANCR